MCFLFLNTSESSVEKLECADQLRVLRFSFLFYGLFLVLDSNLSGNLIKFGYYKMFLYDFLTRIPAPCVEENNRASHRASYPLMKRKIKKESNR